jgi:hypothetical protein
MIHKVCQIPPRRFFLNRYSLGDGAASFGPSSSNYLSYLSFSHVDKRESEAGVIRDRKV